MDDKNEGFLLIGTAMIILLVFLITVLAVMLIYRKRRLEHAKQVELMNQNFSHELLQTQIEVQHQTMQYIGREIHDNVGQKLTLASLYAQRLQVETEDQSIHKTISSIAAVINESLSDLRSLSKDLTDTNHSEKNLDDLVNAECIKAQAAASCKVYFKSNTKDVQVSVSVKKFVQRIIQEFLQNSLKHSACTEVFIELKKQDNGLCLTGRDNGKGFIYDETAGGIGLHNMKKRAEIIGADINIKSVIDKGTSMQLFIPQDKFFI